MHLVQLVVPVLVQVLASLFGGLVGADMLNQPRTKAMVQEARPSIGVIVAERPSESSSGTAFVAGNHLVVTTFHLIAGASRILVKFPDSDWVEPKVLETNFRNDVAVLGIPNLPIRSLSLGEIAKVREGDKVVMIGFPSAEKLGKQGETVAAGTVSGVRNDMLLVQVPEAFGGDGGPILNLQGEVIGVVRGQLPHEEPVTKFAIPVDTAKVLLVAAERDALPVGAAADPAQSTSQAPLAAQPPPAPIPAPPAAAAPPPAPTPAPPAAAAPPPAPTPAAPHPPEPTPAPSPLLPAESYVVVPGKSIGLVRIGMQLQDVVTVLGPRKSAAQFSDGTLVYRWFEPPTNDGLGVRATKAGLVYRIWALNDDRFVVKGGLHVGSTEAQVISALGKPSRVAVDSQSKTKILIYDSLGIWFTIQLDQQYKFYDAVFEIGIMEVAR